MIKWLYRVITLREQLKELADQQDRLISIIEKLYERTEDQYHMIQALQERIVVLEEND